MRDGSLLRRGVPKEIVRFFREASPETHSLIVRGLTGSGKTTFALQLAEELGEECQIGWNYVNVATPQKILELRFPQFRKHSGARRPTHIPREDPGIWNIQRNQLNRLLDAMRAGREGTELLKDIVQAEDEDAEYQPYAQRAPDDAINSRHPEVGDWGARGGEVPRNAELPKASEAKRIPDLPELEGLYDFVERCLSLPAFLVIDTLDALEDHYGLPASKLITVLQRDLVNNGCANVVFVMDTVGGPLLDRLVDGVINIERNRYWMPSQGMITIEKLRDWEVHQPRYAFTVTQGRLEASLTVEEVVELLDRQI